MLVKIVLLIVFFAVMVGVGVYSRKQRIGIRSGGAVGGTVADGLCLWDILLLRSGVRGIRRAVRMEIRHGFHLDRLRKCHHWQPAGVGGLRTANPGHDPASFLLHHAGIFRLPL